MRLHSTVDRVNALAQAKAQGKAGQIATRLMRTDLVILDELGWLPFSRAGAAPLLHLLSRLYERASVLITTHLNFAEWASGFGNAKTTTALLARFTHHCRVVETGKESTRFSRSTGETKKRLKAHEAAHGRLPEAQWSVGAVTQIWIGAGQPGRRSSHRSGS